MYACVHVLRHHSHDQHVSPIPYISLIFLIRPKLAEIWACPRKHIVCMHTNLRAQFKLCAETGLACSPDSIDTLISLIRTNLAEIWV